MEMIDIDEQLVEQLEKDIILAERMNLKTHNKSDQQMVELIQGLIQKKIEKK